MKKVLILPTNLDLNRGDQALVWEAVRLIEDIYGKDTVEYKIMASANDPDAERQKQQTAARGYQFVDQLLNHPGRNTKKKEADKDAYTLLTLLQWCFQATLDYMHTRPLLSRFSFIRKLGKLFLTKSEKKVVEEFENADAIYVKGGGFIHSFGSLTDVYFSYYMMYHLRLAIALGKNVYVLPNSIGPLNNRIACKMTVSTLKKCKLVSVRENVSLNFIRNLGVDAHYFPDFGFYLRSDGKDYTEYLKSHNVPIEDKKVLMTLRPNRFTGLENSHELYLNYLSGAAELVKHVVAQGYHVTFFAHTLGPSSHEDDRIAIHEVQNLLDSNTLRNTSYIEDFTLNCENVEQIYSYYDYMVGTRFHSVIFSLNVQVPSIAIAYGGNKGKGIMQVLENEDYSIDMDKISKDSLIPIFDKLVINRTAYLDNLAKKRMIIDNMRKECISYIRAEENINL